MGKNILITGSSSFLGNSLISNDKENIYFTFGNRGSKNFNVQPINNVNEIKKLEIKDLYHFANFQNENKDMHEQSINQKLIRKDIIFLING